MIANHLKTVSVVLREEKEEEEELMVYKIVNQLVTY